MSNTRILVVDDESKVVYLIREVLNASGFEVLVAFTGEQAIQKVALEKPDLMILDILLSGPIDGYEVAKRVREFADLPIIMLTAKVRESDMLRGFETGADDYITKPFSSKELLARVNALLKRSQRTSQLPIKEEIACGDVLIDLARHKVTVSGREVQLTPIEYNLLHELAIHPNRVLEHEYLLTAIWGDEYRDDTEYLRVYIHNLRLKIEKDPANPKIILRCPGVGYTFACNDN